MNILAIAYTTALIMATYLAVILALGRNHRERMSAYDFLYFACSGNVAANCIGTSWDTFQTNYIAFVIMSFGILLIDGIRRQRK